MVAAIVAGKAASFAVAVAEAVSNRREIVGLVEVVDGQSAHRVADVAMSLVVHATAQVRLGSTNLASQCSN